MEHRFLGNSGFKVPVLGLGTGTFGGKGPLFSAWGTTGVEEAKRLVGLCLDAGVNLFDTADAYSDGASETILGAAIRGRRDDVLLSTKVSIRTGQGPNEVGASRHHLFRAVDAALDRLGTDYIDLLQLHHFDAMTPVDQVMSALDDLVRSGRVLYIGASNFSGWQLMKSLAASDRYGYARFVANQVYYSLVGRDYEWELMPLGLDQGIGAVVWSPLGWGRLTGKIRRGQPLPRSSRLHETSQVRAAGRRGAPVSRRRGSGRDRGAERQDGPAGRDQLAPAAAHRVDGADRRAQRDAAARQPRRGRLEALRRAGRGARCGKRSHPALSVLPVLERADRRAQPGPGRRAVAQRGRALGVPRELLPRALERALEALRMQSARRRR